MISLISPLCPRSSYRSTGRPIIEGKIADGKLPPANPHLTNLVRHQLYQIHQTTQTAASIPPFSRSWPGPWNPH
jgi:hypothetical protein